MLSSMRWNLIAGDRNYCVFARARLRWSADQQQSVRRVNIKECATRGYQKGGAPRAEEI
jgi:hypothetical protein